MKYTKFDDAQKTAHLEARIAQLEAEHFQHTINKAIAEGVAAAHPDGSEVGREARANQESIGAQLAILDAAHAVAHAHLQKILLTKNDK
jgi:hypothetical protein